MKPPPFEYRAPNALDEALTLLDEHGLDGKVLAGGQSLVPLLNFRLARPSILIDINRIGELAELRREDGALHIGAMTRQSAIERSRIVATHWPLLSEAIGFVAHPQIRNRGTVGGSVAHADPSAELPVAFAALEAGFRVRSTRGERTVRADDFFRTHLTTSLESDELLVGIDVHPSPAGTGHAFVEYARRNGDFALGGVAALLTLRADGECERARIALLGAGPTPIRALGAEEVLTGGAIEDATIAEAAAASVAEVEPTGDVHGSTAFRRRLIERLAARAISLAAERAGEAA